MLSPWSTGTTKLAAVFAGLGFVITTRETEIIELNNRLNLRYFVSQTSTVRPSLDRDLLLEHYYAGTLATEDPGHPFLCGMSGCSNYDTLLAFQATGYPIRLVRVGAGFEYQRGVEDARLKLATECVQTNDLPLAAAMGYVGFPVIDITGEPGKRTYILSNRGHEQLTEGVQYTPESFAQHLMRRAVPGKLPLAIEAEDPEHRLPLAYNGTHAYAKMNAHIKRLQRNVLLKAPGSKRRALIPENASDELLDEVGQHFRVV